MIAGLVNWVRAVGYRIVLGEWCSHLDWSVWRPTSSGRAEYRYCRSCNRTEHR